MVSEESFQGARTAVGKPKTAMNLPRCENLIFRVPIRLCRPASGAWRPSQTHFGALHSPSSPEKSFGSPELRFKSDLVMDFLRLLVDSQLLGAKLKACRAENVVYSL